MSLPMMVIMPTTMPMKPNQVARTMIMKRMRRTAAIMSWFGIMNEAMAVKATAITMTLLINPACTTACPITIPDDPYGLTDRRWQPHPASLNISSVTSIMIASTNGERDLPA